MAEGIMGVPWYAESDYLAIRNLLTDGRHLPPTYDKWQEKVNQLEQGARSLGLTVVRTQVDPQTLTAWCAARGMNVTEKACNRFADQIANGKIRRRTSRA